MKVQTFEKQSPVQVFEMNGKDYIHIYVNGTQGEETVEENGMSYVNHYNEYDFAEIIVPHGTLDIDEIKKNPEVYLNYTPVSEPTISDLQDAITALQEIVLGGE